MGDSMDKFEGRVAVVTGGASGIGFALASQAAREGMAIILADVEQAALDAARDSLLAEGHNVAARQVDVSDAVQVETLAEWVYSEFGAVHLLFNNAGIMNHERPAWELSPADWQWGLSVNLWGVVHGLQSFVPRMLAGGDEGHIVNTASMAGLLTGRSGNAIYDATKHAVLSLSESLYRDLAVTTSKQGVSVLCPGAVTTNIFSAERNRPDDLGRSEGTAPVSGVTSDGSGASFTPDEVADQVFDAIRKKRFYILATQPVVLEWVQLGHARMWEGRNPAVPRRLIAERDAREALTPGPSPTS